MTSRGRWTAEARQNFDRLRRAAASAEASRKSKGKRKASPPEGLFRQVEKCIRLLLENPRHPGLQTHAFSSIPHPHRPGEKVFEAYAQNRTPGATRVFWCYGPNDGEITIIAITPHP